MDDAKTSLLAIRDTRKLLVERLPVAWDLLQDESVVFPTREQFLLDWLLDAVFRLLKGATSTDRVQQLMEGDSFWGLLLTLLKRRRVSRMSKPVLPLFSTFIRCCSSPLLAASETPKLVRECMDWIMQHYADAVIGRAPLRHIQELFALPAREILLEERLRILLLWQRSQPQQQLRIFHELGGSLLPHVLLLPECELVGQVMTELVTGAEVVKELHGQLFGAKGAARAPEVLPTLRQLGEERLLKAIVANAKGVLSVSDYRQLVLGLVELLKDGLSSLTMVRQLIAAEMASIQTDDAWARTCALVTGFIEAASDDACLLREIIDLDVALLLPFLAQALQCLSGLGPEQTAFLGHLVRRQSETRQLHQLIMTMLVSMRIPLPVPLLTDWLDAPLARLHSKALVGIVRDLVRSLAGGAAEEMGQLNAARFLLVIANVNVAVVKDHPQEIVSLAKNPRLGPATRHDLCSVLETIEEQRPGSIPEFHKDIVALAEQQHHAGCPFLSLARDHLGEVPSWALADRDACIRYLPMLLSKNIVPQIEDLPVGVLSSLLFWERLADVNTFIRVYWEQPCVIETLLGLLPPGIALAEQTALLCLDRFGAGHAERILRAAPADMQVEPLLAATLFRTGNDSLGLVLFRRGWITAADLLSRDLPNEVLMAVLPILTEEQVASLLSRALAKLALNESSVYETLALFSRRVPDLYGRLLGDYALTDAQRWQLAASFCRHGDRSQVGLGLEDALRVFLDCSSGEQHLLNSKDVMQFVSTAGREDGEQTGFALSPAIESLLQRAASDRGSWLRLVLLLDAFLTQPLTVQDALCPLVDAFLLSLDPAFLGPAPLLSALGRLLHHRLHCGGTNIGRLQHTSGLLDHVLLLASHLSSVGDLISILGALLKFHWPVLVGRRPLLIAWLRHLIIRAEEAPRRVARLLTDFAAIRQADQHFYVGPLLLAACHHPLPAPVRATLTPALCLLVRHLDQQLSVLKAEGLDREKYFDADPLHRLMAQAETDDAKVLLKGLITTYMEEYKFTGKA